MADEAAGWIARLRSDAAGEKDQQAFALWLAADSRHAQAMDSMLELWDDLAVVKSLPLQLDRPDRSRRQWFAGGLVLAASLVLAVLLSPGLDLRPDQQLYQTRIGEQLVVDLADGSQVTLNTNSQLSVKFEGEQRRLELTRGEAFFDVQRDESRPFVVEAGDAQVTVLGTAFNIYIKQGASHISVTEGTVKVLELSAPDSRPADARILHENEGIVGSVQGLNEPFVLHDDAALAWREGKLVAEGMKLVQLVQELSRYHSREVLIADTSLGQQTVSGVFELRDPEAILLALEHSLKLRAMTLDDGSIQLIKAPL